MKIKQIKTDRLKPVEKFLLSFPLKPELYNELGEKLAHLPLIIVNNEEEILFGIDFYYYIKSRHAAEADVIQADISDKEALILNYNMKEKLTGVNLYEKLVFINKVMPLTEVSEIYRKTGLDITVNRELLEKMDLLLSNVFRDALATEKINLKTGLRLCNFQAGDRDVLLALFERVPFSSSHQLQILEMAEEILFRDKCTVAEVFEKLAVERYMDMEKPQKKIIDELFTYRNPVYTEAEERWQKEIKALDLPDNIKVMHYPFFEKKQLEITIRLRDVGEFKKLVKRIKDQKSKNDLTYLNLSIILND